MKKPFKTPNYSTTSPPTLSYFCMVYDGQRSYFQLINQHTCLSLPTLFLHHITYFILLFKLLKLYKMYLKLILNS